MVSPLLANVFLHEVLDEWFETQAKPRLRGPAQLVRYADDAVLLFKLRDDAERVLKVLPRRFEKYGLELHPEKTRLIGFQRPPRNVKRPWPKPETFDLLGFTLYWGRSRRGKWVVKAKTAKDRLSRSLRNIHRWCRQNRHRPVEEQWEVLCRKMKGHYAYYGVTGNYDALDAFSQGVRRRWRFWLARRSQKGQMPWWRFSHLLHRLPLPQPRIMKPYARPAI
ncbi:RNA-directed DNA polymerase (reverse transcriptase) [Halorhodospira halophila SL1]|uniref:RNA-directed DNA polymerase (Reverse transcriptase) n=1 Tax=Halorhodospira halophila (strain DSM 244 / SL1) TaxID=349124 RepID=A1WV30_HALHL|nr:RNA-directed DNA polymerase (reverse transcriptase) [Halorhodospira halophila SL1]MBK1728789.1 RNA-directed DNA polymerase [Halorhodospira halophila]